MPIYYTNDERTFLLREDSPPGAFHFYRDGAWHEGSYFRRKVINGEADPISEREANALRKQLDTRAKAKAQDDRAAPPEISDERLAVEERVAGVIQARLSELKERLDRDLTL